MRRNLGLVVIAMLTAACGASPTNPSPTPAPTPNPNPAPTIVRLNVRVLSRDRYILVNGQPVNAPHANIPVELIGGETTDQRQQTTSDQGGVTWLVVQGLSYKVRARGTEYFGNVVGGNSDWIAYVCGVPTLGSFQIPDLKTPC